MKKSYTEVSMEIRMFFCLDVLTSSVEEEWAVEPNDDIVFGDIFH